jgi:uncharacterized protein YodC (DUF2158 family)
MNKGDVVQLKSGGPAMTVTNVHGDNVYVSFFDGSGELDAATLPAMALKPANEKPRRTVKSAPKGA